MLKKASILSELCINSAQWPSETILHLEPVADSRVTPVKAAKIKQINSVNAVLWGDTALYEENRLMPISIDSLLVVHSKFYYKTG